LWRTGNWTSYSPAFFHAPFAIIVVDRALADDKAMVIALAARNLPEGLHRQVKRTRCRGA
jgi:predicted tellurium resistance membrane protein TerC